MSKGDDTRRAILAEALDLTSEVGLEGLTIGVLAKLVGMSKSGLYAHFASKEELQVAVLEAAAGLFREQVFEPAKRQPRGLPRIQALFDRWLDWSATVLSGGCPFIAASTEFDDRPGPGRAAHSEGEQEQGGGTGETLEHRSLPVVCSSWTERA